MDIFKTVPGFLPAHIVDLRGEGSEGAVFALPQAIRSKRVVEIADTDDRTMDHIGSIAGKISDTIAKPYVYKPSHLLFK